jgi:4-amino-4-deoxy-L-arabinose transferase-like glycosyltransferase
LFVSPSCGHGSPGRDPPCPVRHEPDKELPITTVTRPVSERSLPRVPAILARAWPRDGEAAWVLPATLGVVVLAVVLYVVNLTVSDYANTYYSAAALAASQSWSAWFFASVDPANFITVDKPPLATMLMGLSVRMFGLSSWSILLPEALAGVATVVVLMATVRRTFGGPAAVIAGLVAALTPAAVLMFRYNNPDALLTLLLVGAAYSVVRSIERGSIRWVVAAAALVGFGFLTKYLQAYLVLPSFAMMYVVAAPGSLRRRIGVLAIALVTVIAASGWWVAIVELIPAASRPFIGGSQTNSVLDLLLGYDGLGRIFGQGGGGGGPSGGGGFSGAPGLLRLFNEQFGGQVAWFLPAALGGLIVGLVTRAKAARTDPARAGYILWGGWLLVHVLVFSLMSGIIHTYYAVVLAPAIGALVGGGATELWRRRDRTDWARIALAGAVLGSAILAWQLLARTPDFAPGLAVAILAIALAAAFLLIVPARLIGQWPARAAAVLALVAVLAGPAAYAIDTMQTAYRGGDPSAGPEVANASGPGGFNGPAGSNRPDGQFAAPQGGTGITAPVGGPTGGMAGATIDQSLLDYLVANRGSATWIAAVSGANEGGSIELSTGLPVMAMGGFSGSDPAPTLEQLQSYVASGQLRYILIGGGGMGGPGRSSSDISDWATTKGTVVDEVGGGTLYDLSGAV